MGPVAVAREGPACWRASHTLSRNRNRPQGPGMAAALVPRAGGWHHGGHTTRRLVERIRCAAAGQPRGVGTLPADHPDSPFMELQVAEICEGLGRTRVRQHVNPLRREHQVVTGPPEDWSALFSDPSAPLVVDLGCGPGRFLLLFHHRRAAGRLPPLSLGGAKNVSYLGLEIRGPLVERANEWSTRLGTKGEVHYVSSNATISMASMLGSYPGPIQLIAIQFPDPHFKRRHAKRRIFQPQMVRDVAALLPPGGLLFLQSDVLEVSIAMRNMFEKYAGSFFDLSPLHTPGNTFLAELPPAPPPAAQGPPQQGDGDQAASAGDGDQAAGAAGAAAAAAGDQPAAGGDGDSSDGDAAGDDAPDDYLKMKSRWALDGWLTDNPLGVPTEREHYVMQQGLPVYRVLLVRK